MSLEDYLIKLSEVYKVKTLIDIDVTSGELYLLHSCCADIFNALLKEKGNVSLGKAASFIRRQILTFVIFSAVFLLFTIKYISPSSEYYWGMSNFFSAPFIILTNGCKIRQKIY